ncbi:MAG: hypothetical protein H6Q53_1885, partial [Deltaproteobacteria bacterium]|nr:hypothetical protein [Deltaproteobacteria bacterium]
MSHKPKIKKIIRMLIKNRFYFDLPLQERHDFLNDLVRKHPTFLRKSVSLRGIG